MKKSNVRNFSGGGMFESDVYVILHAKWQASRGRKPSESLRYFGKGPNGEYDWQVERNPQKALKMAFEQARQHASFPGKWIRDSISNLCVLARLTGETYTENLNGLDVVITPTSNAQQLYATWDQGLKARRQAYLASDEYKAKLARQAAELQKHQDMHDAAMVTFETLDFTNLEAVINWLDEVAPATDYIGVKVAVPLIVDKFESNGFFANVNLEENFNGDDEENFARYVIGQALEFLKNHGAIHGVVSKFTGDWREKFRGYRLIVPPAAEATPEA